MAAATEAAVGAAVTAAAAEVDTAKEMVAAATAKEAVAVAMATTTAPAMLVPTGATCESRRLLQKEGRKAPAAVYLRAVYLLNILSQGGQKNEKTFMPFSRFHHFSRRLPA